MENSSRQDIAPSGGCADCDVDVKKADNMADEYRFFLEQYNRADQETDRESANAAAHR